MGFVFRPGGQECGVNLWPLSADSLCSKLANVRNVCQLNFHFFHLTAADWLCLLHLSVIMAFYCILQQKTNPQRAFTYFKWNVLLLTKKNKTCLCKWTQSHDGAQQSDTNEAELNFCPILLLLIQGISGNTVNGFQCLLSMIRVYIFIYRLQQSDGH